MFELKIQKELFCNIIDLIQKQDKKDKEMGQMMSNYTGSFVVFGDTLVKEALMKLLKEVTGDTDDFIEWWLYDDVEKKVFLKNGEEINLFSVESLYDFLSGND